VAGELLIRVPGELLISGDFCISRSYLAQRRTNVREVCSGGNVQGLLGQCALAIVAILAMLATWNL